ncbi:MAG TPA: hypothetical protein VGE70_10945 [Burkholderiaceae bacterium]
MPLHCPARHLLLPAMAGLAALWLALPAQARGYVPQGRCGDYARVAITSPAGTCVALVADEAQGLRFPRRLLEVAPGRFWIIDMGSWEPRRGRLLEMVLPTTGTAPRRAAVTMLADRLDRPHGLARGPDGRIYIGEAGTVWRTPVRAAGQPPQRETVLDSLPTDGAHPLKELAFGPDGQLYISVGSFSDACRNDRQQQPLPCPELGDPQPRAAVYRATLGGPQQPVQELRPFATGLRNSVALAVLPVGPAGGTVLQGENSIDYPDAKAPAEELNHLQAGRHYGWPYCVGARIAARGYEKRYDCSRTEAPLALWPAHAAPLHLLHGPAGTPFAGQLLAAWHGQRPGGHRVVGFALNAQGQPAREPTLWMSGWEAKAAVRPQGRPTGLAIDHRGHLLVVEDFNRTVLMLLPTAASPAPTP